MEPELREGSSHPQGFHSLARDIPIKFMILAGFFFAGLLPVIIVALLSLNAGRDALRTRALNQLQSVASLKKAQLERFFQQRTADALTLASDPWVIQAQRDLCQAFREEGGAGRGRFQGLDQGRFQAPASYRLVHDRYLPFFQSFVKSHGYYDLFLMDGETGEICFTVEKERDFGLSTAQWPASLGDVWKEVTRRGGTALSDTKLYPPSANAAAQFAAASIAGDPSGPGGVVALQIGLEGIGAILADRAGMGETGETYLVGPDLRMRSDASLDPLNHSVTASFTRPVDESGNTTEPVVQALAGRSGTLSATNYLGRPSLAAFVPLSVGEVTWALVAEIGRREIEDQIDQALSREILILLGSSILFILALGFLVSTFIIREIRRLTREVGRLSTRVLEGDLTSQGNAMELGVDFRQVVTQLNRLLGSFVAQLDLLPAPLLLVDPGCRIRFTNLAMATLLGRSREELTGLDYQTVFLAAGLRKDRDQEEPTLPICRTMTSGEIVQGEAVLSLEGSERFFFCTAAPLHHSGREMMGAIEVLVDQTEARRMEQENAALEEQISRIHRLDSLGTLAGGIAHDFNNILGYLFAYTDIARRMIPADSPAQATLDNLGDGIQRAGDLVQRILDFSRQSQSRPRVLDLAEVVRSTLEIARPALPENIRLECNLAEGCLITGDPSQLQQVVLNLFTNGWQAMPEGGQLEVRLGTEVREDGVWVELLVKDTGLGIPEELLTRIFEPFFSGRAQGTGLGLSVVHGIVTRLGGKVLVTSAQGRGAAFQVLLPKAES